MATCSRGASLSSGSAGCGLFGKLFAYWITFRRDRNLLGLMGLTIALGVVFADVVYVGRVRHWGITWVAFVVGLWLQAEGRGESRERSAWSAWTYGLLVLSASAGICAVAGSWLHPFSRAREAAKWIENNEPADALIIGMPDVSFASLAEEMQRRVYFPECDCYDTFKLFSKEREDFDESLIPFAINRAMNSVGRSELLVSFYRPFTASEIERLQQADLATVPVVSFPDADMPAENYFLYRVSRQH